MIYHPNEVARRARIASFVLMAVFLYLGGAFFRTQIVQYERYALRSELNRIRGVPLEAPRGIIYDRNNVVIAENVPGFTVSMRARSLDSLRVALERFSRLIPLSAEKIERVANPRTFRSTRPSVVLSDASFEEVALLQEHRIIDFPGLVIQAAPKRSYPDGRSVAAILGYTREITPAQLELPDYEGYQPGQQVGALGLEEQYEKMLAGTEGRRFIEVDADERMVRDHGVRPVLSPKGGEPLYTNIDMTLQRFIADSVFGDSLTGGVMVMDPVTGEVLALHSGPSFDPNDFIGGISTPAWDSLNNDPRLPMFNKVIRGRYAPASTFKLATAVMALEQGLVGMDEHMQQPCTGSYRLGNRLFHCWKTGGHGNLTLAEAIISSCNVYFYQLGRRLTLTRLLSGGTRFGLSAVTGIDLPNEQTPTLPATIDEYKQRNFAGGFSEQAEELNIAIGQGAAWQTVASMARFYSALATDGYAPRPQLIKGTAPERTQIYSLTPEQNQGVRNALIGVVSGGTAAASRLDGVVFAGKTGTAQGSRPVADAWFVGFAPADKPRLLVALLIESGAHGSAAASKASRIFQHYFKRPAIPMMETGG